MSNKLYQLFSLSSFRFVLIIGLINFFADMTYEGGAAINGQYLGLLGASAAVISTLAGLGEFLGYSLRSVAGFIADKTKKYWFITFIGYFINLLSVPAIALVQSWQWAAVFIVTERIGRAVRKPTIEAMLSYTTGKLGKGFVFSINTAMDEVGAAIGPLLMAYILFMKGDYRFGYAMLLIPSLLALMVLFFAYRKYPSVYVLEENDLSTQPAKFSAAYWYYMLAGAFFAGGILSYELISYHLLQKNFFEPHYIPIFLALATLCAVFANLFLGYFFDKFGLLIVLLSIILSAASGAFIFLGGPYLILLAMPLCGFSYAIQDTLLKAVIAGHLPKNKRSLAFGLYYTGYGLGWLLGSIVAGLLYEHSLIAISIFTAFMQLSSIPIFLFASYKEKIGK